MAINSEPLLETHVANGINDTFSFSPTIFGPADLVVLVNNSAQTAGVHFNIQVQDDEYPADGGRIVFDPDFIPVLGSLVTTFRHLDPSRQSGYEAGESVRVENLNHDFDFLVGLDQENQFWINRSVRFPITYSGSASTLLPPPEPLKAVRWNATATALENYVPGSGGSGGGSGSVMEVNAQAPTAGFTVTGGPITSSGTFVFELADDLLGLESLTTTGVAVRTADASWTTRTITAGTGISLTNGSGVSGNPSVAVDLAANFSWTGTHTFIRTDAGSGVGPSLILDRNSASPLDGDNLAQLVFQGRDSAGNATTFASIRGFISESDNGIEEGTLDFHVISSGADVLAGYVSLNDTTFYGSDFWIVQNSDTALRGPFLNLYRGSADPAASDFIGSVEYWGNDSAGDDEIYARAGAQIIDPTDGTIDGRWYVSVQAAGSLTEMLRVQANLIEAKGTGGLVLPVGTAAQQPAGTDGMIRYNSDTAKFEAYEDGEWKDVIAAAEGGGTGTVTSVAAAAPAAGFTITGSPITTSGTLTFALADDLLGLESISTTGVAVRTASNTWVTRTLTAGTGIGITNGDGISGNPTFALDQTISPTWTGTHTFQLSDNGASAGPSIILDRVSASPAEDDQLAQITWQGRDSGGNAQAYGRIKSVIYDTTSTSNLEWGVVQIEAKEPGQANLQTVAEFDTLGTVIFSPLFVFDDVQIDADDVQINADVEINGTLDVNTTSYVKVAVGTTAQRPGAPQTGMIRFNTTTSKYEGWNGSSWVDFH